MKGVRIWRDWRATKGGAVEEDASELLFASLAAETMSGAMQVLVRPARIGTAAGREKLPGACWMWSLVKWKRRLEKYYKLARLVTDIEERESRGVAVAKLIRNQGCREVVSCLIVGILPLRRAFRGATIVL